MARGMDMTCSNATTVMSESGRALGGLKTKSSLADASRNEVEVVKLWCRGLERRPRFELLERRSKDLGVWLLCLFWLTGELQMDVIDLIDVLVVGLGAHGALSSTPAPAGFNAILTLLPETLC